LVSLLFSAPEFCGCAVADKELGLAAVFYSRISFRCATGRGIWSHCCFLLQNFLEVQNKTKNLVSLLFSVAEFLVGAEQDEKFGLTSVFCLQSFVVVQ
jgi:hypothetical protein